MAALIWDNDTQSFKQSAIPRVWDAISHEWVNTTGLAWDEVGQSWKTVWEPALIVYDHGYDPYNIALLGSYGTYSFQKYADHFYVYGYGDPMTWMGCAAGTGYIDVTNYKSIEVTYGACAADNGTWCALIMANSSQMSGYWWHSNQRGRVVANSTVVTDISHLTGLYRIGVKATAMVAQYYVNVYRIVLK